MSLAEDHSTPASGDTFLADMDSAVSALDTLLAKAKRTLRVRVIENGRISGRLLEVEGGTHVQAPHRRVCVPGAVGSVPAERFVNPRPELRQARQRHRAVLHERDRLHVSGR